MFTVKQTAALLSVSTGLVYGLCAAGKLRHERYGLGRGTIRIPPEAIDEYRRAAAVGPPAGGGGAVQGPAPAGLAKAPRSRHLRPS